MVINRVIHRHLIDVCVLTKYQLQSIAGSAPTAAAHCRTSIRDNSADGQQRGHGALDGADVSLPRRGVPAECVNRERLVAE